MTFARHFWFCLKSAVKYFYHIPRRIKVYFVVVLAMVYLNHYGSGRWPYGVYVVHYHIKSFLLTVAQTILTPFMYVFCRLVFGLLYPAYASYKAVKTKSVKDYVKWMMYWIVFALFCAVETFSDVFLSWVPFYYEIKMIFVFWLLSPVAKGSSFIYRKFVHPNLMKREKEIDEAIAQARTKGYSTLMTLGHKGLTYATNVVVTTAMKGQTTLVEHVKKSYSTNDLRVQDKRDQDEPDMGMIDNSDDEFENRLLADNKELDRREKRDIEKVKKRPLQRSKSDASESRTRKPRPNSGLSRLDEEEHENSLAMEKDRTDEEYTESVTEEIVYFSPRKGGHYTSKEVKSDPYATLPRTRSRHRPRLHQI